MSRKPIGDDEQSDDDLFFQDWKQDGDMLAHATLDPYLFDPHASARLLNDIGGDDPLVRTPYYGGKKSISDEEAMVCKLAFFAKKHAEWSYAFRDNLESHGIAPGKINTFTRAFANDWIDGSSRRHFAPDMLRIKASIQRHDRKFHPLGADHYVTSNDLEDAEPLFDEWEMKAIFDTNSRLIEAFIPDYIAESAFSRASSINHLWVRRGIYLTSPPASPLTEFHYLSSYSFSLTVVEVFAQTFTPETQGRGRPVIISGCLPAVQTRVVAFAPFIVGMDLTQLELVVAPPIQPVRLDSLGIHGGIAEYQFE